MNDLISRNTLLEEVRESRKNNNHKYKSIRFNHDIEHMHFMDLIMKQPAALNVDEVINRLSNKMFSAELHGGEWDGQTVDNLLCMGDVYEILKGGGVDE